MHIVLTVTAGLITIVGLAVVILGVNRMERLLGQCEDHAGDAESAKLAVLEDRHRITGLERDLDATRRELRKVAGKFYADLAARERERDEGELFEEHGEEEQLPLPMLRGQSCENWIAAQTLGPNSEAARCECPYCVFRRAERRALRAALVPKTVQGQAETAKLNSGKP